jgi:DNA repair and recombination protein RAD52
MTFKPEQVEQLKAKLDPANISNRQKAGTNLSYIEGWHAVAEANRIFGHDGWDRLTELTVLGQPELTDGKWRVRYMALVTITVRAGDDAVRRQGVGYGSGIAKDLGDAYEGAIKEAETDATKRALSTFGWPFGLALYDKSREHVGEAEPAGPPPPTETERRIADDLKKRLSGAKDAASLDAVKADQSFLASFRDLPDVLKRSVNETARTRRLQLTQPTVAG